MYKHILVSTDGSKLSKKAVRTAAALAKEVGARLTGVFVVPPYTPPMYSEAVIYTQMMSPARYREAVKREAKKALAVVEIESQAAGVQSNSAMLTSVNPWEGIIRTAKSRKCDLIVMASHGRRGLAALVLGSETTKVLSHSKIPVLVCR